MKTDRQLLIFDLDGTLMHTAPGIVEAINRLNRDLSLPQVIESEVTPYVGYGLKYLFDSLNMSSDNLKVSLEELENRFRQHYEQVMIEGSLPFDGILDFLREWPFQLAVVSNKRESFVKRILLETQMKEFNWGAIFGGDSFPLKKPHPIQILETLKRLETPPQKTVMIGDTEADVLAAKAAQVKSVAVTFGYGQWNKVLEAKPDLIVRTFTNLKESLITCRICDPW